MKWIVSAIGSRMTTSGHICLLTCLLAGLSLGSGAKPVELTFVLPAGSTQCFFQPTTSTDALQVEYQVIAGSGLDVGFTLASPDGQPLVSHLRRSDGIHTVDPTEGGDYRLCFDNSFSRLSEKMVFFEVIINSPGSSDAAPDEWADFAVTESMAEYGPEDLGTRMDLVRRRLEKSRQVLATLRARETRDRYLLEDNLWRVSFWSCMNLLVMLTVGVTQIYSLRCLFTTKQLRT